MISTEIEQKKVEEPTLERMGGFMGWPAGGGGGGVGGGGPPPPPPPPGPPAPPAPWLGKINFVLF